VLAEPVREHSSPSSWTRTAATACTTFANLSGCTASWPCVTSDSAWSRSARYSLRTSPSGSSAELLKLRRAQIEQTSARSRSDCVESKHPSTHWKGASPCSCKTLVIKRTQPIRVARASASGLTHADIGAAFGRLLPQVIPTWRLTHQLHAMATTSAGGAIVAGRMGQKVVPFAQRATSTLSAGSGSDQSSNTTAGSDGPGTSSPPTSPPPPPKNGDGHGRGAGPGQAGPGGTPPPRNPAAPTSPAGAGSAGSAPLCGPEGAAGAAV